MFTRPLRTVLATVFICGCALAPASPARENGKPPLLVFAAASLTNVMEELSASWTASSGTQVRLSFAASSVLARQIEAGGRADLFISADQEWMDYLQSRNLIDKSSRRNLVGNRLVLIAPADSMADLRITAGFPLAAALARGRLSTGDPDSVPVGRYARSALISLGVWEEIQDRLVRADNVRSAMMFVARGEAPFGIVYNTDAVVDSKERIVDTFPENTHAPITYPGAMTIAANNEARVFLEFLGNTDARDTWRRFGFLELK
jgi:molybdate transport system substrate-binding protein